MPDPPEVPATLESGGRFGRFQELMLWRVDNILLVSSLYDSFILAEGGHVNELILGEFIGLNIRRIPNLIRVSTGAEALEFVRGRPGFGLVITAPYLIDMDAGELAKALCDADPEIAVVVLGFDNRELSDFMLRADTSAIDRAFLWQGDLRILLAILKYVEDRMNAAHDIQTLGVQAILVIEDNTGDYSSLLPQIYTVVVEHMRGLMAEAVNVSHRMLRIKARPKILLCSTYEEAWEHFSAWQEYVLGVISDVEFPQGGSLRADAGIDFARRVSAAQRDVPVLLHSTRADNEEAAREVGATFLVKGSPTLLQDLRAFMFDNFGFGDFVFRMPDGAELGRAEDLKSLERLIRAVPVESVLHHAERNHFSVWLKAHTEFDVADELRPRKLSDFPSTEALRDHIAAAVRAHRKQRSRAVVSDFDPATFSPDSDFARIGSGSLGGKARGLAFANMLMSESEVENRFEGVHIAVPPCVVVATDTFDSFLDENGLRDFALTTDDDRAIVERFLATEFPAASREMLRAYLELADYPLAVRSSSLLEDSKYQPFAGIYETHMLPNESPDLEVRLDELLRAIKRVYASTFFRRAKHHLVATPFRSEEEKMAVILQRLVGSAHEDRFYPEFAGTAMSRNFYPTGPVKPEDGIAAVALGLGPTVVEGEECLRFCPRYPQRLVQFSTVEDTLRNTQREFYALRLQRAAAFDDAEGESPMTAELGRYDLPTAERDGTLTLLGSTYMPDNDAVYDGISRPGVRLVTFAPILKHDAFPLAEILTALLEVLEYATGVPVEMEFAADLTKRDDGRREFAYLQLRPMSRMGSLRAPEIDLSDQDAILCYSGSVLGNGIVDDVRDLIVVDYHRFERGRSQEVAGDVARLNRELEAEHVPYVLIGVGRWGSSESLLGIPVSWDQISGARVIVEAGFRDFVVSPSQGSHFFQNLMSNSIGYFTVNPEAGEGAVDWDWLAGQQAHEETPLVRHLRFDDPVVVMMNGQRNQGVIYKPRPT